MLCRVITDLNNTVGLNTDRELLTEFLTSLGHDVIESDWHSTSGLSEARVDVNLYLEKIAEQHLPTARHHIGIFNLEWFHPDWLKLLPHMTQIWAKSSVSFEWLIENGFDQTRYTGWLSRDPWHARRAPALALPPERSALHLMGRSQAKNTTAVMQAYWLAARDDVELPPLTVVCWDAMALEPTPPGVSAISRLPRASLDSLLNLSTFHLCPSAVEGWGHYITEATACGGIVITTDASPMHEHVLPTFGRLIVPKASQKRLFVSEHEVDPAHIVEALVELNGLEDQTLAEMGALAREHHLRRTAGFKAGAERALGELV